MRGGGAPRASLLGQSASRRASSVGLPCLVRRVVQHAPLFEGRAVVTRVTTANVYTLRHALK